MRRISPPPSQVRPSRARVARSYTGPSPPSASPDIGAPTIAVDLEDVGPRRNDQPIALGLRRRSVTRRGGPCARHRGASPRSSERVDDPRAACAAACERESSRLAAGPIMATYQPCSVTGRMCRALDQIAKKLCPAWSRPNLSLSRRDEPEAGRQGMVFQVPLPTAASSPRERVR